MTPLLRKLMGINWLVAGLTILLSLFGVVAVYSATYFRTGEYWEKQLVFAAGGLLVGAADFGAEGRRLVGAHQGHGAAAKTGAGHARAEARRVRACG